MTDWDVIRAEYSDTRRARKQRRPCDGCGQVTQSTTGMCLECQPSLLEPATTAYGRGETSQLGPDDDDWGGF